MNILRLKILRLKVEEDNRFLPISFGDAAGVRC
jgi:hypothetical protein